jgi:acetyltransferase-like isoleucine patch superfamily enzyme
MRALIVETGRKITPFEEAPPLAHWAGTTVGGAVRAALERRGIEIVDVKRDDPPPPPPSENSGPTIVLADHTYVSDKCLGDFLDAALQAWEYADIPTTTPVRLALARTPAVDFLRPVSSVVVEPFDDRGPGAKPLKAKRAEAEAKERVAYDCFLVDILPHVATGAELLDALRAKSARVVVKKNELGIPLRLPVLGDAQETKTVVPVTSTVAAHVEHWVHVLWLNQMAFGVRWMEIVRGHKLWVAARVLAAFPWTSFARFMRSFVWKGRGVRIHPTAHVEASILGDGVVIGPRASVRNSILGAGVEIGDHATVLSSSLGDRTFVTPRTFVVWAAAYPDAVITNYKLQVSLVGRGASLSTWAGLIDAKLQGTVDVKHDGALVSTERSFIGSCIGHGAFVGAKVLVMPGREIPNGAFIAMRPDELIVDVPRDLPAGVPLIRDGGTLVPLERLLPPGAASP